MTPARLTVAVLYSDAEGPPPRLESLERAAVVRSATNSEELQAAIEDAEVLYVADFRSDHLASAWPSADRLRWVHVAGVGVDALLFPELVASTVTLTNSRGVFDESMAEYVVCLLLAFAKDLPETLALQARRTWRHRETQRLAGAKLLIVGAGPIGRAIADLAHALALDTTVLARTARVDPMLGRIFGPADLPDVLSRADFVVVAAPLTNETRGLIGADMLARMKRTARLVNVGRGGIVDEGALADALRAGRLAGAALDVFACEPIGHDDPLWDLPGMIVSPHMSADFIGWRTALSELFLENFRRWAAGRPLRNVVDKQRGYVVEASDAT